MGAVDRLSRADIETLPHFSKKTAHEYSAACPFCGEGEDRFLYWPDKGNYYCRRCEAKGFVLEVDGRLITEEQRQAWAAAAKQRELQEAEKTKTALERLQMYHAANVARYHQQLTDRSWWYGKGLSDETINRFSVGYTTNCPTLPGYESYTIPITYRGKLYNIRHRLKEPTDGGKYRPEIAGLPSALFNADALDDEFAFEIVLVEGEIKAMVLEQLGFQAVGVPGANLFKPKWARMFANHNVYVVFDPGAESQAEKVWLELGSAGANAKLVQVPVKPDDFFTIYGGTPYDFYNFLQLGKPY